MVQPAIYQEMKEYVCFSPADVANVRALKEFVVPFFDQVTAKFYEALLKNPSAREVFTGGTEQIAHQRELLTGWLSELFHGDYGHEYYEKRLRIGTTHLRVGLPQQYMCMGMQLIWHELERVVRHKGVQQPDEKLASLHKLLMLDLAVMLESYKSSYIEQTRSRERSAVEERLTQAEHLAEIGKLAASLAHEIKNPLAGISGAIQVIRDGMAEHDPRRSIIGEIIAQIHRLDSAVRDLLLYARPTSPRKMEVSLTDVIRHVLVILQREPALAQIRVRFDEREGNCLVYADASQIEQLLMNLLINAAHASEGAGQIRIVTESLPGRIRLSITDSGMGMPPDVQRRAFEPFYTTKTRGTGLGLPICKRIVDTHGGTIRVQTAPGKGTTVAVELPAPDPAM